jgi:hypothetical protein
MLWNMATDEEERRAYGGCREVRVAGTAGASSAAFEGI